MDVDSLPPGAGRFLLRFTFGGDMGCDNEFGIAKRRLHQRAASHLGSQHAGKEDCHQAKGAGEEVPAIQKIDRRADEGYHCNDPPIRGSPGIFTGIEAGGKR